MHFFRNQPRIRSVDRGLTTVEIVLIVIVLVIGFGVAWPIWSKQQSDRKRQASLINLRQWGIALNLFLGESQNVLPRAGSAETIETAESAWFNVLPPYLSQASLKDIPAENRPAFGKAGIWINPSALPVEGASKGTTVFNYGMNNWLSAESRPIYKINEVENPMAVVFLAEVESLEPVAKPETVKPRQISSKSNDTKAAAHFLFCDGHVEMIPRSRYEAEPQALDAANPSSKFTWVPFAGAPAP